MTGQVEQPEHLGWRVPGDIAEERTAERTRFEDDMAWDCAACGVTMTAATYPVVYRVTFKPGVGRRGGYWHSYITCSPACAAERAAKAPDTRPSRPCTTGRPSDPALRHAG